MSAAAPTVQATSTGVDSRGHGPYDGSSGPVFDLAFDLAGAPDRPRICHLAEVTGDGPARVGALYAAFTGRDVDVSHLRGGHRDPDRNAPAALAGLPTARCPSGRQPLTGERNDQVAR